MTLVRKSQTTLEDGTNVVVVGDNNDPDFEAYLTAEQADDVFADYGPQSHEKAKAFSDANGADFKRRVDERFQDQADSSQGQGERHEQDEESR